MIKRTDKMPQKASSWEKRPLLKFMIYSKIHRVFAAILKLHLTNRYENMQKPHLRGASHLKDEKKKQPNDHNNSSI